MTDDAMLARILAGDLDDLENEPADQVRRVLAMADELGRVTQDYLIERLDTLTAELLMLARTPEQRATAQQRFAEWQRRRSELSAEGSP